MRFTWWAVFVLIIGVLFLNGCCSKSASSPVICEGYPLRVCDKCGENPVEITLLKRLRATDLPTKQVQASMHCIRVGFGGKMEAMNFLEADLDGCLLKTEIDDAKIRDFLIEVVNAALEDKDNQQLTVWVRCYRNNLDAGKIKVLLMDSPIYGVVYNKLTQDENTGGSNADDITTVLKDLPIQIFKETTNREWNRHEQVVSDIQPDLIVMHLSAFYGVTTIDDPEGSLRFFIDYVMKYSNARLMLYSRGPENPNDPSLVKRWRDIKDYLHANDHNGRLMLYEFNLPYKMVDFRDSKTYGPFKMKIKEVIKQIEQQSMSKKD